MKTCKKINFLIFAAFGFLIISSYSYAEEPRAYRIINGQPAVSGSWPWMVALMAARTPSNQAHLCGGALIDSNYVITAAHCVLDFVDSPKSLKAVIGRNQLTSSEGITVSIDGITIHRNFSFDTSENDIALLHLRKDVPGPTIPIVTSTDAQFWAPGTMATILGWGVTDAKFPIRPDNLQQASIPIVSDAECQNRLGLDFRPDSMLCAGTLASTPTAEDGIDSCQGDSGGPLMVETASGWKIAGIVSWGYYCGSNKYWGIYTQAGAFYDWVNASSLTTIALLKQLKITGTPRVGEKIHCRSSSRETVSGKLNYQWLDSRGKYLKGGAKKRDYFVKKSDIGKSLMCQIILENSKGRSKAFSRRFGPIRSGH